MGRALLGTLVAVAVGCSGDDQPEATTVIDSTPDAVTNQPHAVFAFHADGFDSFTCFVDNGRSACTSPFSADVADGTHSFSVAAGEHDVIDDSFAGYIWQVDTTPPDTTIVKAPSSIDNSATETITFVGTGGATSFECALDAAAFAGCTSPASITPGDGDHTFRVRAIDALGNTDATPAAAAWTLDTTTPDTAITAGPADASTTAPDVTFSFSSPDATATFECAFDTSAFAACASPRVVTLGDGDHTFAVRAKDTHGLVDPSPATRAFHVDAVAPAVAIDGHPGDPSNDTTPTFTFSSTDPTATFECQLDTDAFAACTSPTTTEQIGDGSHAFRVRATDPFDNQSAPVTFSWTIDATAPGVTITIGPSGPTNLRVSTFRFTTSGNPTTIQCRVDANPLASCVSPFNTPSLADGPHSVTVVATDAVGNAGSATRSFSVDATPPAIVFDSVPPVGWPVTYFDIKFHTDDAGATLQCQLNSLGFTPCASPVTVSTIGVVQIFTVRATDSLGNVSDKTTTWQFGNGVVLDYRYEQGSTTNSSQLADIPGYTSDGSIAVLPFVGGWAGTAAASPPQHHYANTKRALSTAPDHEMTASVWIRPRANGSGIIWSNATATDGLTLSAELGGVRLTILHNGETDTFGAPASPGEWHNVVVTSTGPSADAAYLYIDGELEGIVGSLFGTTGFDDKQANDLVVGPLIGVDIDQLQFHTGGVSINAICTLARGIFNTTNETCLVNRPAYELSFEGTFDDTGFFHLPVQAPASSEFVAGSLGQAVHLTGPTGGFSLSGFGAAAVTVPEHSFTFSVITSATSVDDTLLDFMSTTATPSGGRVTYVASQHQLQFSFTTTTGVTQLASIPVGFGRHSVVIAEQLVAGTTQSVKVYVDSETPTTLTLGSGTLITTANDQVSFATNPGWILDEFQFWPRDLSATLGLLCENGLDGELDNTNACVLPN